MIQRKIAMVLLAVMMMAGTMFTTFTDQSTAQAATSYTGLEQSLNKIMSDNRMKNSTSSVTVRRASTGKIIYQFHADTAITPASSLKLLTSAAALDTLGEKYRFPTEVLTDGQISKGIVEGNLYLRGKGDPTLMKRDLDNFATKLAKMGIKQVSGNLIADDTWFDDVRLSPSIAKNDESYSFAAQISALTLSPDTDYDAGSIIIDAKPTVNGRVAKVSLTPATTYVNIVNKSRTVPKGNKNTLRIVRQYGTNTIMVTGNAPVGSAGRREFIAVSNPTAYTLHEFKRSLTAKGIKFAAGTERVRGQVPETAHVLSVRNSMPLKDLMKPFMKLSNNTHAEVLAKAMGKEINDDGSWDAGLTVMRDFVEASGLDAGKWRFEDASGMSHANKVTSAEMSELLYIVRSEPWYRSFLQGLPIAGANERFVGGTLRNRLKAAPAKGNIIAKTGSLNNINALAGYAQTKDGETLIFSVLTQGHKTSTVPVIDRIATSIANSTK